MKRLLGSLLAVMLIVTCSSMITFASDTGSLDDVINNNTSNQQQVENQGSTNTRNEKSREEKNADFIAGLNQAADLTGNVEGVAEVTSGIKLVASWIVQVLSYGITILLALRVVLDLAYIGLPFTRAFLANGYQGNAQAGAGGMPNSMMNGGMAGPMGGGMMGGPMGGGMMGGGMYGRSGMYGRGPMGGAMGQSNMAANMNQGGSMMGRIQWVSNAALNAVAAESSVGPDGKAVSPFKNYCKDMAVVMVLVPVLLTLAVTGTLTNLGFLIGDMLVDAIASVGDMI